MEGSRAEEKVGCWALATPSSVLRSNAGPWIPWPLPAAGGSRGKEALNYWERGEKPSAAYMGVSDGQRNPHSKERCMVDIFSRYLEAAAEQPL